MNPKPKPLPLPDNFNPETLMLVKTTEYGTFHESRQAARLAAQLLANGTAEDIDLAERVLAATLQCQELDERDPHHGNFYWMREDEVVEDLNAVEFVLNALIPMLQQHGDRLSASMRERVLNSIRLGLTEIQRLDVLVAYTNITILDIVNSCLGGELLDDPRVAARGYAKLVDWIAFTNRSGHPFEYSSPTYGAVALRALKRLVDFVQDEETRIRAKTMAARLALSMALHIHQGTGRWAGPHSRAYQPSVVCETPPEVELLEGWMADQTIPGWTQAILDHQPASFEITETAERSRKLSFTTYHTASFALGVASQRYSPQSNVCMVHYRRPAADRPGVFYTRYILNDKWFGDSYHATDRTKTRNLPDEGNFYGVQHGQRAICVYSPEAMPEGSSAKAALIWTGRDQIDKIWVEGVSIERLPLKIDPQAVVVIESGQVYMAIKPLMITPLGRETPVQLLEREGDLVLELSNYQGVYKRFWESRWPGAFYQGRPICAFYLEVADRQAYVDGPAFGQAIAAGRLRQQIDQPFTYPAEGERLYTVSYQRKGQEVGLEIDLMAWQLKRRWTEAGELGWPMMDSPLARQTDTGQVEVGQAILSCNPEPAWLLALPAARRWVAGYTGLPATPLTLTTPQGQAHVPNMNMGVLIWDNGRVSLETIGDPEIVVTLA